MVRCLDSIIKQDYKHVEVIISDDSPNEDIKQVIDPYVNRLNVRYFHNSISLGSPKNWNAVMDKAVGDYVLLLHQDDWFHATDALTRFLFAFKEDNADFVFCQNTAIDENNNKQILQARPGLLSGMRSKPNHLLLAQVIGPPSNTMVKKSIPLRYDENFIWLVDVDYYSRLIKAGYQYHYINSHLVSIGLHNDQTTEFCRTHPDIIFKENIMFSVKIGSKAFSDILIYDYYWRLLRNYGIRTIEDLDANGLLRHQIPAIILHMLQRQKKHPLSILRQGIISKILMTSSYLSWKFNPVK